MEFCVVFGVDLGGGVVGVWFVFGVIIGEDCFGGK